jgi:hypothetical protein
MFSGYNEKRHPKIIAEAVMDGEFIELVEILQ